MGPRKLESHSRKQRSGAAHVHLRCPRCPQCGRRGQAGPREQVGQQRQGPGALETAAVHKRAPPCSLEPPSPGGRAGSGRPPVSGDVAWRFGRDQLTASRGSSYWTPGPQAGSATHPSGVLDPGLPTRPQEGGQILRAGPRATTRGPLSGKGRETGCQEMVRQKETTQNNDKVK